MESLPLTTDEGFYLPHFPVVRPDKTTTKVRVVLDARAEFNGRSLNDFVLPGPKISNDVDQVLLGFRRHAV